MTFQELLLDADDNIKVQSAEEWVAPEFDFSVEDGKDGAAGGCRAAAPGRRFRSEKEALSEQKRAWQNKTGGPDIRSTGFASFG